MPETYCSGQSSGKYATSRYCIRDSIFVMQNFVDSTVLWCLLAYRSGPCAPILREVRWEAIYINVLIRTFARTKFRMLTIFSWRWSFSQYFLFLRKGAHVEKRHRNTIRFIFRESIFFRAIALDFFSLSFQICTYTGLLIQIMRCTYDILWNHILPILNHF